MIDRPDYINAIMPSFDKPLVKILAGIRRHGAMENIVFLELKRRGCDVYPKYVVTMNSMDAGIENGIKIVHLADLLLEEKW